ncbi:MAG: hypothetical protein OWQ57_13315 [Sulfobacillus sp.]|nr:hypothetical protein [Sulfobacillus sp.]
MKGLCRSAAISGLLLTMAGLTGCGVTTHNTATPLPSQVTVQAVENRLRQSARIPRSWARHEFRQEAGEIFWAPSKTTTIPSLTFYWWVLPQKPGTAVQQGKDYYIVTKTGGPDNTASIEVSVANTPTARKLARQVIQSWTVHAAH